LGSQPFAHLTHRKINPKGETMKHTKKALAAASVLAIVAAGCGSSKSTTKAAADGKMTPVKLQLQWVAQAQFAGYYAAVDQGYYKAEGLDVNIIEAAVDTVPQKVLADGQVDFALSWVPKALATAEAGADIVNIGQIYQRSGTRQVSFKEKNITKAADFAGKKIGNWGFGNEFEVQAAITKAGVKVGENVAQQFDMKALLAGEIDAAEAMTYNEYAQVLEAKNPKTGKLYTPDDFNVVDYNAEGAAMLQDAVWADGKKLAADKAYQTTATKFLKASVKGWAFCRDNAQKCADIVVAKGSKLGKSHQLWQMNEVNKLIWPSPKGAGIIDPALWKQTLDIAQQTKGIDGKTILTKAPSDKTSNMTYMEAALAELKKDKVDVEGAGFKPITVTLNEGGA
jgi:NitT/TauT family transport system substrate-binding protein